MLFAKGGHLQTSGPEVRAQDHPLVALFVAVQGWCPHLVVLLHHELFHRSMPRCPNLCGVSRPVFVPSFAVFYPAFVVHVVLWSPSCPAWPEPLLVSFPGVFWGALRPMLQLHDLGG